MKEFPESLPACILGPVGSYSEDVPRKHTLTHARMLFVLRLPLVGRVPHPLDVEGLDLGVRDDVVEGPLVLLRCMALSFTLGVRRPKLQSPHP